LRCRGYVWDLAAFPVQHGGDGRRQGKLGRTAAGRPTYDESSPVLAETEGFDAGDAARARVKALENAPLEPGAEGR